MDTKNLITEAINKRIDDLSKTVDLLKLLMLQPIVIENIVVFKKNERISSKIPNEKGIYFFTAEQKDIEKLYDEFKKVREMESKQGEVFAKLNTDIDLKNTDCIYVGSSNDLQKRFVQHVEDCHKKTYAIKFYKWLPDGIKINFHYHCLNIEPDILQNIEEGLREIKNPILGKSGKSSK